MKVERAWWFGVWALCAVVGTALPACGDDDDDNSSENAGGSGGKSGEGGKGGSSSAGKGGSSSAGKGGSAAAVTCGGETCKVNGTLAMLNPAAKACCTKDDDKCGQVNSAGDCLLNDAPGTPDSKCPDVEVSIGGTKYPQAGCCTPKGQCGGNFMAVGFGCVARENLQADMGGPLEAISCGGAGDNDAGTDAGN